MGVGDRGQADREMPVLMVGQAEKAMNQRGDPIEDRCWRVWLASLLLDGYELYGDFVRLIGSPPFRIFG